ncbi:MAG: hypothetical protein INH43_09325 [Acidobacteriaceae bacterium]|nr:hypothetical protein [Acidobacteriaceae bacterium]
MSEYTIAVPMHGRRSLEVICDAINYPDSLHDMVYAAFRGKAPDWAEHGWELRATPGVEHIFVTARRKT